MDDVRKLDAEVSEWIFGKPTEIYEGRLVHPYHPEEWAKEAGATGSIPDVAYEPVPHYSSDMTDAMLFERWIEDHGLTIGYIMTLAPMLLTERSDFGERPDVECVEAARNATPRQRAEAAVKMMKARHGIGE